MTYFTSQKVRNAVQIIKYVELSRIQPILKLEVTFVASLFTLKPFFGDFYKIYICDKMGVLFIFHIIDYA